MCNYAYCTYACVRAKNIIKRTKLKHMNYDSHVPNIHKHTHECVDAPNFKS